MFVYHYLIIPFHPQYLPKHAPQGGGIQGGGISGAKLSTFHYYSVNISNHFLVVQKHEPQVIALQEVWKPGNDFKIPGYVCVAKHCRKDRTRDGVAMYCKATAKHVDKVILK